MMKLKAYRGTNLNEAVRIINNIMPRKYLYWITDRSEADGYASVHKYDHAHEAAAVVEAEIDIPNSVVKHITQEEFDTLYKNKSKLIKDKVAIYDLDVFKLIVVSPTQTQRIKNSRIVEVL